MTPFERAGFSRTGVFKSGSDREEYTPQFDDGTTSPFFTTELGTIKCILITQLCPTKKQLG